MIGGMSRLAHTDASHSPATASECTCLTTYFRDVSRNDLPRSIVQTHSSTRHVALSAHFRSSPLERLETSLRHTLKTERNIFQVASVFDANIRKCQKIENSEMAKNRKFGKSRKSQRPHILFCRAALVALVTPFAMRVLSPAAAALLHTGHASRPRGATRRNFPKGSPIRGHQWMRSFAFERSAPKSLETRSLESWNGIPNRRFSSRRRLAAHSVSIENSGRFLESGGEGKGLWTMESVVDSHRTRASASERSIVSIVPGNGRDTKNKTQIAPFTQAADVSRVAAESGTGHPPPRALLFSLSREPQSVVVSLSLSLSRKGHPIFLKN